MKKLIAAILIFAFAFCITACGKGGDSTSQQAISSSEALPQNSSMPQQASSQDPNAPIQITVDIPSLTTMPGFKLVTNKSELSPEKKALYDDYFSTEKEFTCYYSQDFPEEETYVMVDMLSRNLCRSNKKTSELVMITNLFIGTLSNTRHCITPAYVYAIVNDYTIIRCNRSDFSDVQRILTSGEPLDDIYCDDNLMYYRKANTLYRLHLASGMQEAVLTFADEYEGFWPLSNLKIRYHKRTAAYQQFLDDGGLPEDYPIDTVKTFPYIYTLATGEAVFDQAYLDSAHTLN